MRPAGPARLAPVDGGLHAEHVTVGPSDDLLGVGAEHELADGGARSHPDDEKMHVGVGSDLDEVLCGALAAHQAAHLDVDPLGGEVLLDLFEGVTVGEHLGVVVVPSPPHRMDDDEGGTEPAGLLRSAGERGASLRPTDEANDDLHVRPPVHRGRSCRTSMRYRQAAPSTTGQRRPVASAARWGAAVAHDGTVAEGVRMHPTVPEDPQTHPASPPGTAARAQRADTGVDLAAALPEVPAAVRDGLATVLRRRLVPGEHGRLAELVAAGADLLARHRPGQLLVQVDDAQGRTVIDSVTEDVPALVSTLLARCADAGLTPTRLSHPVLSVARADDGTLQAVGPPRHGDRRTSWIRAEAPDALGGEGRAALEAALRRDLAAAARVAADRAAMAAGLATLAERIEAVGTAEAAEAAAFLRWLHDGPAELLGVAGAPAGDGRGATGTLGLAGSNLRTAAATPVLPPWLTVARSHDPSPVQHPARLLDVRGVDPDGGEVRILVLPPPAGVAHRPADVPVARRRLAGLLAAEDVPADSHDGRLLSDLFAALPLDAQLTSSVAQLQRALVPLLGAGAGPTPAVGLRRDAPEHEVAVVLAVDADRFEAGVGSRLAEQLRERTDAATVEVHETVSPELGVVLDLRAEPAAGEVLTVPDVDALSAAFVTLTTAWDDEVRGALRARIGGRTADRVAERWLARLPAGYRERLTPAAAAEDLLAFEELDPAAGTLGMRLLPDGDTTLRAKLLVRGGGMELSRLVPVLESLGLVVVDEVPYDIDGLGTLHDVGVRPTADLPAVGTLAARGGAASAAALAALTGRSDPDDLDRLVLLTALDWRDVTLLRALRRYRRQLGTGFTEAYQNAALVEHAAVAEALVDLFDARLAPAAGRGVPEARRAVEAALAEVTRLDQDRILRGYLGLVEAVLRTNRYVEPAREALALKFDSARVPGVGKPVPHVETFVAAPSFEGVHLRGGPVARGGLRHSDRREDVRAEVLDLMKAQMTKNAVIVPAGAKGGFVLTRGPGEGGLAVPAAYEAFIGALLDLTDDLIDGTPTAPQGVRAADGPDPYLVVAPDRGTGTFSDAANKVATGRGFWLGDAFASGGSQGYDHKAMGITARGAWVAVRRHFAELGLDVDRDPLTVVGVGDMSGDVFGNALLQSTAVRLVGAFDHRDVFLDPDPPDAAAAHAERARLAALPGSSWQDYRADLLGPGGVVASRQAKVVPLPAPTAGLLRTDATALSPPEIIRLLLAAPVDLLFFGGIGTYVKAESETHAEVGDRANDAVRLDAGELGARVVGEGANLGLTPRARIAYARRGGRCNTDAIDNAAGVATSDLEVNLKILLAQAVEQGRLDAAARDAELAAVQGHVADRVLADCDRQTWALTREVARSPGGLAAYEELMADLSGRGELDREVEALPDTAEVTRRARAGAGLTRPELATLFAYAKLDVRSALLASDLPEDPAVAGVLHSYFPGPIVARFGDLLGGHRLRRELIATRLAGAVVDDMGITWVRRVRDQLGCDTAAAVAGYHAATQVLDAGWRWEAIAGLGSEVDTAVATDLDAEVGGAVDACARVYARREAGTLAATVAADTPVAAALPDSAAADAFYRTATVRRWLDAGVPAALAEDLGAQPVRALVPDVAALARTHDADPVEVAAAFAALERALPLGRLDTHLAAAPLEGRWDRWQREGLAGEVRAARREAVAAALARAQGPPVGAVQAWTAAHRAGIDRVDTLVAEAGEAEGAGATLTALAVVVRTLREVTGGVASA